MLMNTEFEEEKTKQPMPLYSKTMDALSIIEMLISQHEQLECSIFYKVIEYTAKISAKYRNRYCNIGRY